MSIIKPLALLFRCVGISPSSTPGPAYKYLMVAMSVAVCLSVYTQMQDERKSDSMSKVLLASSRCLTIVASIGFLVYNFLYGDSYPSILRDLKGAEDDLRAIGATPHPTTKTQCRYLFALTFSVLFKIVSGIMMFQSYLVMVEVFLTTIIYTTWTQHVVLVCQLSSLFSALNDQLIRISAAADDTPVDVVSAQLQSVFRIHSSLHVTLSKVNGHFFIYNFATTASRLLYCIIVMYNYLVTIDREETRFDAYFLCIFITKMLFFITQCVVCQACAKEANHTVLLAHYTLQPHTPFRLWKEVGDFSSLYINNKVEFSVGGVFTLDRPLITRFSVLALSYLIVAVQLKDAHIFDDDNMLPTSTIDTVDNMTHFDNVTVDYDYIFEFA